MGGWLLTPAEALLGRLRFAQKFALVGLVLAAPLAFVASAYVGMQRAQIAFSAKERVGVAIMAPLVDLTASVVEARHRATAGRNGALPPGALARVDAADRRHGSALGTRREWQRARGLVLAAAAARPGAEAFRAHGRAVDTLLELVVDVGDRSNLTLDPDLDTYYLMDAVQFRLPLLLATSGRMVDEVALARAAGGDQTDTWVAVGAANGELATTGAALAKGLRSSLAATRGEALRRELPPRLNALHGAGEALRRDAARAVRDRDVAAIPSGASDALRAEARRTARVTARELDGLLAARIAGFDARARRVVALAAGTGLLALYLVFGFYRAVTRPVRRMVSALRAVGSGDLSQRVEVGARDELGFIARALNDCVAETQAATERLERLATSDGLTGLPNRTLVLDRLEQALARMRRTKRPVAVVFLDLDHFKPVNDVGGHSAGDAVLKTVASRLRDTVRPMDTVGRLAGDEFVVICEDLADEHEAVGVAQRLAREVTEPIRVRFAGGVDQEVAVGASVGIAFARPGQRVDGEGVLADADVAMYRAKQRGRGRVEVFDEALRASLELRVHLQQDLRRAIRERELILHYQPVVHAGTGALSGFEALVRWQHPERGLLAPGEFIPLAEGSGLIVPIGAWVLEEACAQLARWRATEPEAAGLVIAVNVSAVQLADPELTPTVAAALDAADLEPEALWLEVTESAVMVDPEAATARLGELRALGVQLALDDFGTGHSSLAHLRSLPIGILKLDRSFVQDEAVIASVAGLARALDLHLVAEGVETPAQLSDAQRLGCDAVQGFLYGRPVPAPAATELLATARLAAPRPAAA